MFAVLARVCVVSRLPPPGLHRLAEVQHQSTVALTHASPFLNMMTPFPDFQDARLVTGLPQTYG